MKVLAKNKRARFDYELLETLGAGIVLRGFEVKSLKTQTANLTDAIVKIDQYWVWLINCDIPLYKKTSPKQEPWYEPKGRRKLLVTKQQAGRLRERTHKTWFRLIPIAILADARGLIKVKLALAKLKKTIDKRHKIRERDEKRLMKKERL